jgi:hypothetical protein
MLGDDEQRFDLKLVVGRTIGEMNALHRRLDAVERELGSVQGLLLNRPSRSERYLLWFMMILLGLLTGIGVIAFRLWSLGKIVF